MQCSPHALRTLEFDKIRDQIAERTASPLGKREIETLAPTDDPELIDVLLQPVLEGMDLIAFGEPISVHNIPDAGPSLTSSAAEGAMLTVQELLGIGEILTASRRLHSYMSENRQKYPRLWTLTQPLQAFPDLEDAFRKALDPVSQEVKDSASTALRRIRRNIENLRVNIRKKVESVVSKLSDSILQERLVTLRSGRFVIPVRENQKGKVEGLVHDQSSSGATLFMEPMVTVELNNQLRQLELAEVEEIRRILRQLTAQVGQISLPLRDNLDILGKFDAIYAKAAFCRELDCTEPLFNSEGKIHLRGARHPLLVHRLKEENQIETLVPLDLILGDEAYHTLILTGPNAGGKTVTLKTVGLLAIIAQAGLPIPAREKSELPIFSGIFADIGDAQSIENDLSTFSSHVTNLVEICNKADGNALILLDEIGASTDPDEGSALAVSLLQEFTRQGCRTMATTHHGALKAVAHESEGMANGSMTFDADTLSPTFHLRTQVPGSSYAFEIARRLGMPDTVVDEAVRLAGTEVRKVESLILDLDATYQRYETNLKKVQAERQALEAEKIDYETRLKDVESREQSLKRSSQEEAQRILSEANALVERTVAEIRSSQASKSAIKQAHTQIQEARQSLTEALKTPEEEGTPAEFHPGDLVFYRTFGKEGTIFSPANHAGRVLVEIGNVKVEVSPADLELREKVGPSDTPDVAAKISPKQDVPPEIDVRGLIFDEAADVVDRYLDQAFLGRLKQARIIHGKGTGALKLKLGDYLKTHPLVKSQRSGGRGEGDWGVTVVQLDIDP